MAILLTQPKKLILPLAAVVVVGVGGVLAYNHFHHSNIPKLSSTPPAGFNRPKDFKATPYGSLPKGVITSTTLVDHISDYSNKQVSLIGHLFKVGDRYIVIDTGVSKPKSIEVFPASPAVDLKPFVLDPSSGSLH